MSLASVHLCERYEHFLGLPQSVDSQNSESGPPLSRCQRVVVQQLVKLVCRTEPRSSLNPPPPGPRVCEASDTGSRARPVV